MIDNLEIRFTYHAPDTEEKIQKYIDIRSAGLELARLLNEKCPDSREKSLAITSLEEVVMWANAAIARNE